MEINKIIKSRRLELGLTLKDVSKALGIAESTVSRYESSDIQNMGIDKIEALSKVLRCSPAYLMGWESLTDTSNVYPIELKRFPLLGEIACGEPRYTNEDRESYIMAGTTIEADFCLRASGDSMINARIYDGDIVFIRKQNIVENGDIAAIVTNGDSEATLKRLFYYKEKGLLILKAENPKYNDLIFQDEELNDVHILGKAVAFQSDVK